MKWVGGRGGWSSLAVGASRERSGGHAWSGVLIRVSGGTTGRVPPLCYLLVKLTTTITVKFWYFLLNFGFLDELSISKSSAKFKT